MAISLVQKNSNAVNGAPTVSVAYGSNVTSGNLLVAIVSNDSNDQSPSTVSDTRGNTWTLAQSHLAIDGFAGTSLYYATANATGPNTVTWSVGGGAAADLMIFVMEYSGIPSPTLDQTSIGGASPGSITTTNANEVIIAATLDNGGSSVAPIGGWAATNSFTVELNGAVNSSVPSIYSGTAVADRIVSATGTYSTTFSDNGAGGVFFGVMASFFGSGAAAPTNFEISLFGTKRQGKPEEPECTEYVPPKPVKLFHD